MKKQIEKLRAAMEAAQTDEMKEIREKPSMVYISRSEIIQPYFEGYEQALKDMEDNDPAYGADLMLEITYVFHRLDALVDQARAEAVSYEDGDEDVDEMSPEQAYAEGCLSAYKIARYQIEKILDTVNEARIRREIEGL